MTTKLPPVDIVIVGMGWTGGILAKELGPTGLKIVVLERGAPRSPQNDFAVPLIRDELRFSSAPRHDDGRVAGHLHASATIHPRPRCRCGGSARSCRAKASAAPARTGTASPGAGRTMSCASARKYEERYGKNYIPADMPLQDWGVSGDELEPYYDKFEYVAGISGKAGNIKGVIQKDGNAFEDPRSREYPLPPLIQNHAAQLFTKTAKELGYHPFVRPTANASQPYTNPDGMKIGQCQYCGFCERFGCEANAKGSPLITVIPVALRNPNVELRTYTWVTKVLKDSTGKKATGVQLCERADRRGDRAAGGPRDPVPPTSCRTCT